MSKEIVPKLRGTLSATLLAAVMAVPAAATAHAETADAVRVADLLRAAATATG